MNRLTTAALITLVLVIVTAFPAPAGDLTVPTNPSVVPPLPEAKDGTLALDISSAYQLALARNLDIQVGRYSLASAGAGIITSSGIFDPTLDFGVRGNFNDSPSTTELEGTQTRDTAFSLGIGQLLPTGGNISASAYARRDASNYPFVTLNPSYRTDVSARFTQPLLDGFGTKVNRSGIVIAGNTRDQTAIGYEIQIIATLLGVEQAYWDFIAAREAVAVDEQSLELAQRLLDETNERVKVGTSAPIDLVQSEAGVATRLQDLILSRNRAANAEDDLKAALGFDQPAEWLTSIEATESYEADVLQAELAEAITIALEHRPAIRQKELNLEVAELYVELARNRSLPDLDFEAAYGFNGIAGDTGEEKTGIGDAFGQFGDFPHWTLGIRFGMPLGNNDAQGALAQRRYELEREKVELAALKQQIILEVRKSVRALHDGAAAVEAAVASTELASRNLEAEYTKFNNGLSTNYLVLDIQNEFAIAQLRELNTRIQYRKAIASYYATTGTLLHHHSVKIVDPGAPESPHNLWKDVEWLQFVDISQAAGRVTSPAKPVGDDG